MKKNGFTMVEMLVVISLLAIVGVIILTIFSNTLKGTNKSQIISVIKENGQSILENMDKTIRGSDNVVCVGTAVNANDTLVVKKAGQYIRYRMISPSPSVNGYIQQDFPQPLCGATDINAFEVPLCGDSMGGDCSIPAQTITDTNTTSGVSVDCYQQDCMNPSDSIFTRTQSSGPDQVTIKFNLSPGVAAPQAISGQIDPVSFQTTIELRNTN